jgi:cellulose synthase/poly-beta-1,6-N-acetylglucosamine synthase-like glycosyltransferase
MVLGYFALRARAAQLTRSEHQAFMRSNLLPAISIIAPAYNEAATISQSVRAMLKLHHPDHTVIVVNDGSTDETLQILIDDFNLYRSGRAVPTDLETAPIRNVYESADPLPIVVVDKENGGKADSLNAGLLVCRTPLFAAVDADSILEENSLLSAMRPFLEDYEGTLASGGIVRVVNGCRVQDGRVVEIRASRALLPLFQTVEYLRAFLGGRVAFSFMNSLLLISGAFGLFRRDVVIEVGGFGTWTVGEDMELVMRMHDAWRRKGERYRIVFVPDPVCWTEVPDTWRILRNQRNRWQRGTVESLRGHYRMLLNPRYGAVGMFAFPYFLLFEMLGPTVELAGYLLTFVGLAVGIISPDVALVFFVVSLLFGLLLSAGAVLLEDLTLDRYPSPGDAARLFAAAVPESLGFRQLTTLWRARGLWDGLRGKKGWGAMERRGFDS